MNSVSGMATSKGHVNEKEPIKADVEIQKLKSIQNIYANVSSATGSGMTLFLVYHDSCIIKAFSYPHVLYNTNEIKSILPMVI